MHSNDFEALQLYQQTQKETMEKRMDGLSSAINEIKEKLETMSKPVESPGKARRGHLQGGKPANPAAGPPLLNAVASSEESGEPSMKEVMGVLTALARDVSELKVKS